MHFNRTVVAEGAEWPIVCSPLEMDLGRGLQKLLDVSALPDVFQQIVRFFNSGAPMSRRRTEQVKSSFLSAGQKQLQWPCQLVVALAFPAHVFPVDYVTDLLEKAGYATPDDAVRANTHLPNRLYYCHNLDMSRAKISKVSPQSDAEFLHFALILGLCGPNYYDPKKPVIWTEGRLTRTVGLYLPRGFYEA